MRKWPSILTWWSHSLPLQLPPRFPQTSPEFLCYISSYRPVISTWTFCKFFRPIYSRSFQSPFILWVCSSSVNGAAIQPISDPSQRARFTSNSFLFYPHIQLATLNSPAFLCPPSHWHCLNSSFHGISPGLLQHCPNSVISRLRFHTWEIFKYGKRKGEGSLNSHQLFILLSKDILNSSVLWEKLLKFADSDQFYDPAYGIPWWPFHALKRTCITQLLCLVFYKCQLDKVVHDAVQILFIIIIFLSTRSIHN